MEVLIKYYVHTSYLSNSDHMEISSVPYQLYDKNSSNATVSM